MRVNSGVSGSLSSKGKVTSEDEKKPIVGYHLAHIVQGIWKLFADTPLGPRIACILLAILALIILCIILNFMTQLAAPIMNLIYTILGISASAIAIYEFLNPGPKKRS